MKLVLKQTHGSWKITLQELYHLLDLSAWYGHRKVLMVVSVYPPRG